MLWSPDALWLLVGALALDALVGDPDWLWRRLPHPVVGLGAGVAWLDRRLNREAWSLASRRAAGVAALVVLVGASFALGAARGGCFRQ